MALNLKSDSHSLRVAALEVASDSLLLGDIFIRLFIRAEILFTAQASSLRELTGARMDVRYTMPLGVNCKFHSSIFLSYFFPTGVLLSINQI